MLLWIANFVERATRETELLRRNGAEQAARARERLLGELAEAAPNDEELLSLTEAARESGYSSRTLHRMLDDGRLTNYGRPSRPQIRRSELPLRHIALREATTSYRLETAKGRIAKSVINPKVYNDDNQGETI
jgi:hypothetical protein